MSEERFRPRLMGSDLQLSYRQSGLFEDADLTSTPGSGDLSVHDGVSNFRQAVANRLKTRLGELEALGHGQYGSRHHELVGEPNVERTRNLIKLYVLQALRREPRIDKVVAVEVVAEHDPPRESVRIEIEARPIRSATVVNLVVPFSLEAVP